MNNFYIKAIHFQTITQILALISVEASRLINMIRYLILK